MLAIALLICRAIVASKFGKVLIAIRDAESRTRFLGYRVESYKLFVFTLSACMAGIAGALYVPQVGIINPSEFAPANSIEAVIWVAVGGRGTLIGAILGAVVVNYAKTYFTSGALAPYWLFVLGGLFVGVTLLLPRGIIGTVPALVAAQRAASRRAGSRPAAGRRTPAGGVTRHGCPQPPPALLYLDGITVSFDGFRALNELSLDGRAGRDARHHRPQRRRQDHHDGRHHRQDPARYGRRAVRRQLRPDRARRKRDRRARHRPQVPEADGVREHTVEDNLLLALKSRPARPRATLFWRDSSRRRTAASTAFSRSSGSPHVRDRVAGGLSHGQKQWLEIGMLLAQEPKLLLVDEPVAGMTDAETQQTAELLKEINRDRTVVVVEHDMAFVRELGVKVTVLHEGSRAGRRHRSTRCRRTSG